MQKSAKNEYADEYVHKYKHSIARTTQKTLGVAPTLDVICFKRPSVRAIITFVEKN